jgi:hypothetical protein
MSSEVETSRRRRSTVFYGISRLCFAPLGMTFHLRSTEKLARSREKFGPVQAPVPVSLVAARAQDYLAIPDISVRDTILIGILNHVTS